MWTFLTRFTAFFKEEVSVNIYFEEWNKRLASPTKQNRKTHAAQVPPVGQPWSIWWKVFWNLLVYFHYSLMFPRIYHSASGRYLNLLNAQIVLQKTSTFHPWYKPHTWMPLLTYLQTLFSIWEINTIFYQQHNFWSILTFTQMNIYSLRELRSSRTTLTKNQVLQDGGLAPSW